MTCALRNRLVGLLLVATASLGWAGKAHVHGLVKLDVAVEAGVVTLAAELPMDSLLGFERAPRSDAERKAAAGALALLRDGSRLFRLDTAAQCTLESAEVDAPLLERPAQGVPAGGHADVEARYTFSCAQPLRLATLEVLLFDVFKRIDRIEVQAVLPQGQARTVLRRAARQLRLAR